MTAHRAELQFGVSPPPFPCRLRHRKPIQAATARDYHPARPRVLWSGIRARPLFCRCERNAHQQTKAVGRFEDPSPRHVAKRERRWRAFRLRSKESPQPQTARTQHAQARYNWLLFSPAARRDDCSVPARLRPAYSAAATYARAFHSAQLRLRSRVQSAISRASDRNRSSGPDVAAERVHVLDVPPVAPNGSRGRRFSPASARRLGRPTRRFHNASTTARRRSSGACRTERKNPDRVDSRPGTFGNNVRFRFLAFRNFRFQISDSFAQAFSVLIKPASRLSPQPAGVNITLQQRARAVLWIAETVMQNIHDCQANVKSDEVSQRQWPHRMIHSQLH